MRITLLFSVIPFLLFSQEKKEYPFEGHFDLGLNYKQSVETTLLLTNDGALRYKVGEYEIKLTNKLEFLSELGEEEIVNNGEQKIKWNLKTKNLNIFISSAHLYNHKLSIKKRFTNEVGIHWRLEKYDFNAGVGFLNEDGTSLENIQTNKNRISGKLNYTTNIGKRIEIKSRNNYLPNIEKFGDFEFDTSLDIIIIVNKYWRIILNNTLKYTSYPVTGIPETYYTGINKISYTFFW